MNAVDPNLTPSDKVLGGGVLAEKQPEYLSLPFAQVILDCPVRHHDGTVAYLPVLGVVTRWQFSDEDRAAIARGDDLFVHTVTFGEAFQPVKLTIGGPQL